MAGFYSDENLFESGSVDSEALYNHIDNLGNMLYAPVKDSLESFDETDRPKKAVDFEIWMACHEFGHTLNEGTHALFVAGAVDPVTDSKSHVVGTCLHSLTDKQVAASSEIEDTFRLAVQAEKEDDIRNVGYLFARIGQLACDLLPSKLVLVQ